MPGPDWAGRAVFYEDFPYAWWSDFIELGALPPGSLDGLPAEILLGATYADITDQLERKVRGISLYASQLERLFGGEKAMADAVRGYANRLAGLGGVNGAAERYWSTRRV